jgi:hypothetical protein
MIKIGIVLMIVICLIGAIYLLKETKEKDLPRQFGWGEVLGGCLGGCLTFLVVMGLNLGTLLWLFISSSFSS